MTRRHDICPAFYINLDPELIASLEPAPSTKTVEGGNSTDTLFDEAALEKALTEAADNGLIDLDM